MQKDGKIHCRLFALFFLIINFSDPAFEIPEVDGSLCSEETGVSVWDNTHQNMRYAILYNSCQLLLVL